MSDGSTWRDVLPDLKTSAQAVREQAAKAHREELTDGVVEAISTAMQLMVKVDANAAFMALVLGLEQMAEVWEDLDEKGGEK